MHQRLYKCIEDDTSNEAIGIEVELVVDIGR